MASANAVSPRICRSVASGIRTPTPGSKGHAATRVCLKPALDEELGLFRHGKVWFAVFHGKKTLPMCAVEGINGFQP